MKEVNVYYKYLRCPDLRYNNFDILSSSIALDKLDLVCSERVKAKLNSGYIITQWKHCEIIGFLMDKIGENKKIPQGWENAC